MTTWIKCSDRLPEEGKRVLLWFVEPPARLGCESRALFGHLCPAYKRMRPEGYTGDFSDQITHWMPLPDPPKEDA